MGIRRFHWDVVDDCVLHETDGAGNTLVAYTHEPGQFGPLLSENRGGTESYHHYDALGSTTMLTNDAGAVSDTFQYDAWGSQVARTGTTPTPYTWVGRWGYQDDAATTGGYYIRARSYQPAVARWVSVDPIEAIDNDIDNSTYSYSHNDPIDHADMTGESLTTVPPIPSSTTYLLALNVIVPARALGSCGAARQEVEWSVSAVTPLGAAANRNAINGWILQEVTFVSDVKDCDGNTPVVVQNSNKSYIEGWQVTRGVIHIGRNFNPPGATDLFQTANEGGVADCRNGTRTACRKGTLSISGRAKFVPNYAVCLRGDNNPDCPWFFNPEAGDLPVADPLVIGLGGLSGSSFVVHALYVRFDCCTCPITLPLVTGVPQ